MPYSAISRQFNSTMAGAITIRQLTEREHFSITAHDIDGQLVELFLTQEDLQQVLLAMTEFTQR